MGSTLPSSVMTSASHSAVSFALPHHAFHDLPSELTIPTSDYDAFDALLHSIYEKTQADNWFKPASEADATGVCIRAEAAAVVDPTNPSSISVSSAPSYRVFPYNTPSLLPFLEGITRLTPSVAVALQTRSAAVFSALRSIPSTESSILLDPQTRIQILENVGCLGDAERDQCAAFIRSPRPALVLWAFEIDDDDGIVQFWRDMEEKLVSFLWKTRGKPNRRSAFGNGWMSGNKPGIFVPNSDQPISIPSSDETLNEQKLQESPAVIHAQKKRWWSWKLDSRNPDNGPDEKGREKKRKIMLFGPVYAGLGAGLAIYFMTAGVSILIEEYMLDGDATRFALCITLPVIFCVSLFFCLQLIGNISLIFGPVAQYHENSAFYSAIKPAPNPEVDLSLPHITIQCPVYKESLKETIAPSLLSIKRAMKTYAQQGGTSSIFLCDDGLQLISEDLRKERLEFYRNHNIGWVARPAHNSKEGGYKRRGKFKKASNMNYALALSIKLEKHYARLLKSNFEHNQDQECLEDVALRHAIEETYEESGRRWRPWAANGKSLRMGEIVLIIDADTIVPEDCFLDAAREMYASPELAIIQHESDVMQVAHHYFENGITHFTRRINRCISYGCANGEVAPFVGHNAFLRWSAMQDVSFVDPGSDSICFPVNPNPDPNDVPDSMEHRLLWNEARVSEDFDMALRLLLNGYTLRWATYSEGGFKEGVSLTVVDELARWQKYAYGCDEIIFNPLIKWWKLGPISEQLRGFVWSAAPIHYKIGMMSYMFSYYGLAAGIFGGVLNYLLLGMASDIDRFYLHSFEVLLACVLVFPALGNVGFTLLEYRLGYRKLFGALWENVRWIGFFLFFFGGLSIHLSTAILAHLFSYDMTWGSTGKEVEKSTFWIEVPRILKNFRLALIICFLLVVMIIVFDSNAVPAVWRIEVWNWALIIPLAMGLGCHIGMPIVLNPWLMKFTF